MVPMSMRGIATISSQKIDSYCDPVEGQLGQLFLRLSNKTLSNKNAKNLSTYNFFGGNS